MHETWNVLLAHKHFFWYVVFVLYWFKLWFTHLKNHILSLYILTLCPNYFRSRVYHSHIKELIWGYLFLQDEILTVIRRVDENWAEGMLGDKIGIFPILYVEVSPTAACASCEHENYMAFSLVQEKWNKPYQTSTHSFKGYWLTHPAQYHSASS